MILLVITQNKFGLELSKVKEINDRINRPLL